MTVNRNPSAGAQAPASTEPTAQAPAATDPNPAPAAAAPEASQPVDTQQVAADAAAAEQARVAGILQCEESEGKAKLAQHLAFNTRMSVEDAKAALAAAEGGATASVPGGMLSAAMRGTDQPNISADAAGADTGGELTGGARLGAAYEAATGKKRVTH